MKKYLLLFIFILSIIVIAMSCQNGFQKVDDQSGNELSAESSEIIVLGARKNNPYSLARARASDATLEANQYYIRVKSNSPELLEWLRANYEGVDTIPIDYDIVAGGTFYDDPFVDESLECSWFYLFTDREHIDQLESKGFSIEIIQEMYVDFNLLDAMQSGNSNQIPGARGLFGSIDRKPSGYVRVWDSIRKEYVPLRNVKVVASQWLVFASDFTDENGYYSINTSFNSFFGKVRLKVVFGNEQAEVNRCINEDIAQYFFSSSYSPGDFSVSAIQGQDINLADNTLQAKLGTTLKAVGEYHIFASAFGIEEPDHLKVVTFNGSGGMALMGRSTGNVLFANGGMITGALLGGPLGAFIGWLGGQIITSQLPDLLIGINSPYEDYTEHISRTVYHECAHASHEQAVGDIYWWAEYFTMLGGWMGQLGDGSFDAYNGGASELVCFIESWGYFIGFYGMQYFYPELQSDYLWYLEHGPFLPYLYYDGIYDLMDTNNEYGDYYNGATISDIFDLYRNYRLKSALDFFNAFVKEYGSAESVKATLIHNGAQL
jgi:hypothetical protein